MSGWSRFWPSGRSSPFEAVVPGSTPYVSEDNYSYIVPDSNDSYNVSVPRNSTRLDNPPHTSPDILVLKHRGTTYPLHLPAFSIAEGELTVGNLRRLAAEKTNTNESRRVKLLYKGKILKDDSRPCRDEGLKQNSELMCVISEAGHLGAGREDAESSDSADSEEMLENGIGGPRPIIVDADDLRGGDMRSKRKNHRAGRRKKTSTRGGSPGPNTTNTPRGSSSFLAPTDALPPRGSSPGPRAPSPSRPRSSLSSNAPQSQSQPPLSSLPNHKKTPLQTLEALSHAFHTTLVPQSVLFTNNPPTDSRVRDLEYKKLSESILAQIILKLDAVDTEGDEGLRAKRKQLVRETQEVLGDLDRVGKGGAGR